MIPVPAAAAKNTKNAAEENKMKITTNFTETRCVESSAMRDMLPVVTGNAKGGTITFSCSIADVHSYWHSFMPSVGERIPWTMESTFAAQRGMPFVVFFNTAGISKLAVGLVDCDCDSRFSGKMNQETGCYDITWEIASPEAVPDFKFWFDVAARPWQEQIPLWRENLSSISCEFPRFVWEPVFCTWYAVHGAMTQEWCTNIARKAADLGFKTFILDDGWCYPDMKRVSPTTISTWYEKIGDWQVDTTKFPDFKKHVEEVRSFGLKYMLWVAPYLIGDHSAMYEKLKNIPGALFGEYLEGYYKLAPENSEARAIMLDLMENLMRDYDLDGLKVDFLDQIHPNLEEPRAEACYAFTAELSKRIRKCKADALIEFRQSYAVPRMLACGTQFRAGDAPFDFLLNLRRIAQIRLVLGDGIPVHADPAYWPADELPVNISRHFIAMMAGVPMLSVELADLTCEAEAICRFWIGFYQKNSWWLREAHWEFDYSGGQLGCASGEAKSNFIAIVTDPLRLPELPQKSGYVLNMSYAPVTLPGAQVFDWKGEALAGDVIPEGCGAFIKR